ncbi:MAG: energy-coupling factor transporter ATPase [Atribacterota bacterium]|nr:energy-coupling factor transporter ATPase [Atribacterota bacterium]MDD4896852.1 energy-coupling factor transporter ATPase [Atribacterota bacterium]MDD5636402.1 energy-coupling factor transporter ATPase [Atribacterota bacterium]
MIKFDNVTHFYNTNQENKITSLSKINLEIQKGDFVAIIGSNGSGKSTLAKHINGLLLPSKGNVFVENFNTKDIEAIWDIRKKVGIVFQNPDNQLVATTVEDDIAFGLENIGIKEQEMKKRVDWALNIVGLNELRNSEPHLLSGGEKQRVVIAGALAMHTSYLVLDEPTSMLDPRGRKEILEIIKRLNREENITIVYITQFMSEATQFKKIFVLNKGEVILTGSPKNVFNQAELLISLGLEVPQITKLARKLAESGLDIPSNILNEDEMIEYLCLYI